MSEKIFVIPPVRTRYLSEIAESNRAYDKTANDKLKLLKNLYGIYKTLESVVGTTPELDKAGIDENLYTAQKTIKILLNSYCRI